jgi:hypothetical protein
VRAHHYRPHMTTLRNLLTLLLVCSHKGHVPVEDGDGNERTARCGRCRFDLALGTDGAWHWNAGVQ